MRSIGQLLMVDGCSVVSSLSSSLLRLAQSSSPHYLLPHCSRLHFTECRARAAYSLAYQNYTKLKVYKKLSFWHQFLWYTKNFQIPYSVCVCDIVQSFVQDSLEQVCVMFHDQWQGRCGQLLQASFPRTKFWKSLNKSTHNIIQNSLTLL